VSGAEPQIRDVLVVDDEHDIRTVARMALRTIAGWNAVLAESGTVALERVQERRFDVILLDVMMPGMDGIETLSRLRRLDAKVPVVMVTAKAQRHEIESYFEAGAAGVITKPFDPMTLADRIRDLVGTALKRSQKAGALASRLAKLREGYVKRLPDKIAELDAAFAEVQSDQNDESMKALRTLAHKLHGTGGSYGLTALSEAAGALERAILDKADLADLDVLVQALREVAGRQT
jgi:CheY-like chemotaxis protein